MNPNDPPIAPLVTLTSAGGPHDDDTYLAGWEMGSLDANLKLLAPLGFPPLTITILAVNERQADLIAMSHDCLARFEPTPNPALVTMTIHANPTTRGRICRPR